MPKPVSQFFRFIFKLVMGLFAALFAVSLVLAALIVVIFSLLKSLITGRKPVPAMVFGRFQQFSSQGLWPSPTTREESTKAGNVVDVEVREVHKDKRPD